MNADVAQMNAEQERLLLNELSRRIIGAAQQVSSTLGYGFLEKVYENAIAALERAQRLQCLNYLRATRQTLCLLLNFGRPHLEVARIVWHF